MALVPLRREQEDEDRSAGIIRNTPFGDQGDDFGGAAIRGIVASTPFGAGGSPVRRGFARPASGRAVNARSSIRRPTGQRNRKTATDSINAPFDFGGPPKGTFTEKKGTFTNPRGTFVDDPSRFNFGDRKSRTRFSGFF